MRAIASCLVVVFFLASMLATAEIAAGALRSVPAKTVSQVKGATSTAAAQEAARLVEQALEAEAAGDEQARAESLSAALSADPDYAPAHWHLGEISVQGRWQNVEASASADGLGVDLTTYCARRRQAQDRADDQLKLARWCADVGLTDQEQAHLRNVFALPHTAKQEHEAMHKLGLVQQGDSLVPVAQIAELKREARNAEATRKQWKPVLARLRHELESHNPATYDAARGELLAINDPALVPVIEEVFARGATEANQVAIEALSGLKGQPATDSLVRYAIFSGNASLRESAAKELAVRDFYGFVPLLLSNMVSQIKVDLQTFTSPAGSYGKRLSLFREGPLYNMSLTSSSMAIATPVNGQAAPFVGNTTAAAREVAALQRAPFGAIMQNAAAANDIARQVAADGEIVAAVADENVRTEARNQRITDALRIATGNHFGTEPHDWWNWWTEYTETHYSQDKPTYEEARNAVTYYPAPQARHSCFVAGTKVWTLTGAAPIETIRIGDWVLAQNVDTGELAYKAVQATTIGKPLPLVTVHAGKETIRCTFGHLFWVSGVGWRMAKDLEAGQRLHTTHGAILIDNVERVGEASCHNLIVPEFDTYFVTDEKILVHDIDVRGPTDATVPGLIAQ